MEEKIKQIEALLRLFRLERYAYLFSLLLCAFLLIGLAIFSLLKDKIDLVYFVGLLTPSGAMIYIVKDILKMWNDVLEILKLRENGNS
jgi:phosphatidylserine synthase